MILFWVTLLVLHRGYTLVPVTTVQLGEPATFTCALPNIVITRIEIHWYKQSTRETLQLMVTLHKSAIPENAPEYAPQFSESRLEVNIDNNFSNLTILRTIQEDEGLYHCEIRGRWKSPEWSGTYLSLKGNTRRTSNCTSTGGTILIGDGTKVEIERTARYEFIALVIATVCLVISVIGNIVFICCRTSRAVCSQFKGIESVASQARHDNSSLPLHDFTEGGPELNYAALHFSGKKATRGRKKRELNTEESVYSQVKC
ncbi:uncharacterized protein LOC119494407 [Sebastes umbrosus]|uniref:uncharacterized protein LOC119494407 n=1 Tax=Sebastes umbrosus TaxID=72105 RepID=UPI00189CDB8A|nr:uncharacterized protein LOC119494407 [Sebastes umbrosus]